MSDKKLRIALAGNANVGKSIDGKEYVFVYYNGLWKIERIREVADEVFDCLRVEKVGETEFAKPEGLFVVSLNPETLKVEKQRVTYVLRHKEKRKLIRLETSSGRTLKATQDHNFMVLRRGKLQVLDAKQLLKGDLLPVIETLPILERSRSSIDIGNLLSDKVRKGNRHYQISDEFVTVHGKTIPRLIEKLAFSDIVWDEVTEIEDDFNKDYVYDLSVEANGNFMLANGLFVHNSVIFNHLTGLHQHIGNWPGKTVEKAEGTLHFRGYTIDVVDLPGIYSLSPFSIEEKISREYIACENPDVVVNVVDASVLERNLYFTLQLMELEKPMIIALNQMDMAKTKGIEIDTEKLAKVLGVPVISTIATKGVGLYDIVEEAVRLVDRNGKPSTVRYGDEVEKRIMKIAGLVEGSPLKYPPRYTAVQLLQGDEEIEKEVEKIDPEIVKTARKLALELEEIHGHPSSTVIASERYGVAARITRNVQTMRAPLKPRAGEILHNITTNRLLGYPIMAAVMLTIFYTVFTFGDFLSKVLTSLLDGLQPIFISLFGAGPVGELIWGGLIEGLIAGITIALPYIAPFYVILYFLEDSGYLSRIAFLMDSLMHKIGLHGKAFIPVMLGYGCNVPACLGCRIMETERERLIAGFITTLIPCAARTVIILGLVGAYVGVQWALALYIFDLLVIFVLGRIAFKVLPGEPTALIMEMSDYRVPRLRTVVKQTWFRLEEFAKIAFPLIVVGSLSIKLLEVLNLLEPIGNILSPITVAWLGLPMLTGAALIFGVLRKELTLVMLATLLGTTNFANVLTPLQMIVFTLVTLFYIPCVSTIAALIREFGLKKAILITSFEIVFAIAIGGVAFRLLQTFIFQ